MVTLTVVALHPAIPALDPGLTIGISRALSGGLTFHIPGTLRTIGAVLAALRDGALVPPPADDPYWKELEAIIFATRDELLARADQMLLNAPAARSQAS